MKTMSEMLAEDEGTGAWLTPIRKWLDAHGITDAVPVKNVSGFVVVSPPCFVAFFTPEQREEAMAYFTEERNVFAGATLAVVIADETEVTP